ncbi:MAG: WYL domain-containing protein [Spirochaetes bacterium]|jgi:proteasome accessory factor B|nr:WYL domain-containing protein [Spirochaetota bacterium]
MSFRARMQRIAFIHRRLKYKRDYPSARDLAEDYLEETGDEFSARTFKRDIEWLRDQQAPLEYDAQRHGYYYADEAFELPTVMLTEGDLLAVLVTERALSSYRNSPYYDRLRSIFDRLTELLPEKVTVHSEDLAQNVTIVTEPVTEIDGEVWQVVHSCLERERSVTVSYRKPGYTSSATRVIDPYHIVGFRGEWYLIGYSHHDAEVRIYALGRFTGAKATTYRFTPPADFDAAEYIDPAFGVFLGGETRDIAVHFDATVAAKIRERQWHPRQEIAEQDDGAIVLRLRTNQTQQTLFWVSQWGPNAEILEPADLREQAAAWLDAAAARYRD